MIQRNEKGEISMKNKIETFKNSQFGTIRTLTIDNEPWFVGKDVADTLGYQNGSRDINRYVEEEDRHKAMIFDGNQNKETIIINESGLYSLILSSKLPKAKEFKRWVTSEVLPSIRKQPDNTEPASIKESNNNEILNINNVRGYLDKETGTAYLNAEDVSRGFGFTTVATSGNVVVRWNRVNRYLAGFGFSQHVGKDDFLPENMVYRLGFKANNETAQKFQAILADEVLPSIRKHGAYMTDDVLEKALTSPDFLIKLATQLKEERAARELAESKVKEMEPKALFADAVSSSHQNILVGELAKLLHQNGIDIGQNKLFAWLRENGYLIKGKRSDYNMPTQRAMSMGLFTIKETAITHSDGHITINKTVKVTGKGQLYFVNLFLNK